MPKAEYIAPKEIASLDELKLDGEETQLDLTEDAWSYGAPPPAGDYKVKWVLAKNGIKTGLQDQRDPRSVYVQLELEGKIVESKDGEYDDIPVFARLNTRVYRGKNISTMAAFLGKIVKDPKQIPNPISPKRLAELTVGVLKKEPVVRVEADWRGSYSYKDKNGVDIWENVYKSMAEFPDSKEVKGTKQHVVSVTSKGGGMAEVRAMLQVERFYAKGEEVKRKTQAVVGGNGTAKPVAADEPELVFAPVSQVASAKATPVVAPVADDELIFD